MEGNTFTRVGRRGDVPLPDGASRVDLTGKTVMPAIINAHGHVGYRRGKSFTAENYTRENIIDHLQRLAYHGVAAVMSMGAERAEGYALRDELRAAPLPDTALFLTAGRASRCRMADPRRRCATHPTECPRKPRHGRPSASCTPGRSITTSRSGWTIAAAR